MTVIRAIKTTTRLEEYSASKFIIVEGLPYSGKTTAIQQVFGTKSIYPPNKLVVIEDLNQIRELTNDGSTTRIYIKIPNSLTEEELATWSEQIKRLAILNRTFVIEGRKYTFNRMLGEMMPPQAGNDENLFKRFLLRILSPLNSNKTADFITFDFKLSRDDAMAYLNNRIGDEYMDEVIRNSRIKVGKDQTYSPLFLNEGEEKISSLYSTYQVTDLAHFSIDYSRLHNFVIDQVSDFPTDVVKSIFENQSVKEGISNIADSASAIASSIGLFLSIAFPIAMLIPMGLFALKFARGFNNLKKEEGLQQLIKFFHIWKNIPPERRDILAYEYDQALKLSPGTTLNAFESLFNGTEQEFGERIQHIEDQIDLLYERIELANNDIEDKILKLRTAILDEKGVVTEPSQIGFKNENGTIKYFSLTGIKDSVEVVLTEEYENLRQSILHLLLENKLLVVSGEHGIGKSVFGRYVVYQKMQEGEKIISLDKIPEQRLSDRLGEFKEDFFFYDPSSPEIYSPRKEVQGTEYQGVDVEAITSKIKSMINLGVRGLIILPSDIADEVLRSIEHKPKREDVDNNLKKEDFLKGIIKNHLTGCVMSEQNLNMFAEVLLSYSGGFAVVAAYLGRWLSETNCLIEDIWEALERAKNQPIRFLQNFIWSALLRKDQLAARQFSLPLLVHVNLGKMQSELAMNLPCSLSNLNLPPLQTQLARWISRKHEDIMEQALRELANSSHHSSENAELDEMKSIINEIKVKVSADSDNFTKKLISFLQQWISNQLQNISASQLDTLLKFYAESLVGVEDELDAQTGALRYIQPTKNVDDASSILLRGVPYTQGDLLEQMNVTTADYCVKLKEIKEEKINNSKEIEGNVFIEALSFVVGAAKLNSSKCLIDCLFLLSLGTQKYKHFALYLYWKTGKRLLDLADAAIDKNEDLAAAVARYIYAVVMIGNIRPEDRVLQIIYDFSHAGFWICKIVNMITIVHLGRLNNDKEPLFHTTNRMETISQSEDFKTIYSISLAEAGSEIVLAFDSLNKPDEMHKWYELWVKAVSELRNEEYNPQVIAWLKSTQYFVENPHAFENWLNIIDIKIIEIAARIKYREMEFAQTRQLITRAEIKKNELGIDDDLNSIYTNANVSAYRYD